MVKYGNYTLLVKHSSLTRPPNASEIALGELALQIGPDKAKLYTITPLGLVVPIGEGATLLDQLEDTDIQNPTNKSQLVYNFASKKWIASRFLGSIYNLDDVNIAQVPVQGEALIWDDLFKEFSLNKPYGVLSELLDVDIDVLPLTGTTTAITSTQYGVLGYVDQNEMYRVIEDRLYKWQTPDLPNGVTLVWNSTLKLWETQVLPTFLYELSDVNIDADMRLPTFDGVSVLANNKQDDLFKFDIGTGKWKNAALQIYWDKTPALGGNLDATQHYIDNLGIRKQVVTATTTTNLNFSNADYFIIEGAPLGTVPLSTINITTPSKPDSVNVYFIEIRQDTGLFMFGGTDFRYENGVAPTLSGPGYTDLFSVLSYTELTTDSGSRTPGDVGYITTYKQSHLLFLRAVNLSGEVPAVDRVETIRIPDEPNLPGLQTEDLHFSDVVFHYDFEVRPKATGSAVYGAYTDKSFQANADLVVTGPSSLDTTILNNLNVFDTGLVVDDTSTATLSASNGGVLGTGPFTYEFFVKFDQEFICAGDYLTAAGLNINYVSISDSLSVQVGGITKLYNNAALFYRYSTFNHVAVTRTGDTIEVYVRGRKLTPSSVTGTTVGTLDITSPAPTVSGVTGQIDSLRLTKYLRYTGNFTPPARKFATYYSPPFVVGDDVLGNQVYGLYGVDLRTQVFSN